MDLSIPKNGNWPKFYFASRKNDRKKKLIGFLYPDEILKVFAAVNLIKSDSFRHSCAVRMLSSGLSLSEIRNHLGHEDLQSTTIYLHLDISQKRQIQKQFLDYIQSSLKNDPKLDDLIDWENRQDTLSWLDSL